MTLRSGNTFRASTWSDGKVIAAMFPRPPAFVKCRHCGKFYWRADAQRVGEIDCWRREERAIDPNQLAPEEIEKKEAEWHWFLMMRMRLKVDLQLDDNDNVDREWLAAEQLQEPSEADYYVAIETGLEVDPEQETRLRFLAWWRGNDVFRDLSTAQTGEAASVSDARRRNLWTIASRLRDGEEAERILKAEVFRELGEFGTATELLRTTRLRVNRPVVRQLLFLCEREDLNVRELVVRHGLAWCLEL